MNHNIYPLFAATLVFLLLFSIDSYAGNRKKAGVAAGAELLIPVGTRDMAMGGATIATTSGIDAIFWNPAGLARTDYSAVATFSRTTYIADIDINYVAVAGKFGNFGTVGFSIKSLAIGDIPITTEDQPDGTGASLDPTFITVGVHYGKLLIENVAVGFSVRVISENLREARVSATGFSFSAGVQYQNAGGLQGLDLGVAVKHIGPQMGFSGSGLLRDAGVEDANRGVSLVEIDAGTEDLPSTIEIGVAYTVNAGEFSKIHFATMFQNNNFSDDQARFGVEYEYNDLFFLRAGFNSSPDAPDDAFIFGPTLGAGAHVLVGGINIFADYAWQQNDFFDNQNTFSIRLGF
ncbi:MAG: PorV/PorQ family protein [bacterium]